MSRSPAFDTARTARFDTTTLTAVRSVGSALPADVITGVITGTDLPGLDADTYHLELGLNPREAANRAWATLRAAWLAYRDALDAASPPATGLTREKWLSVLLRELGFGRVPPTPAGGIHIDGRAWPVSHLASGSVPVHLLGWNVDLDRKTPGLAGAAERAPHAMVQDLLNRADEYLWAIVSNGSTLRLLRDASTLIGPSYVEFNLTSMFDDELFSDFVVLYLLCHQSRFEPTDPDAGITSCWLERWRSHAAEAGVRALGDLRTGVHDAIETIGSGLLSHPDNTALRTALTERRFTEVDLQRAITRLVYRIIFCFVAEDRDQLLDPDAPPVARRRYLDWFSTARLRRVSISQRGDRHSDLWQSLQLVLTSLGHEEGCPELGLAGLGGIFEEGPADQPLHGAKIDNRHLLTAIRQLSVTRPQTGGPQRVVDYQHLGAEELGGIYENLLEYVPHADIPQGTFELASLAGNDRKKTGAYYTPTSLTETLLDSALDPLLERAAAETDPEAALLALRVCDPACGSGHFLVAAARRIAGRLATVRAEGAEPTETQMRQAMHDVVSLCIYGVDVNPQAAELAKVGLWLEGMTAGSALNLLDGHIKVGNALLGTTPALLAAGIPDDAYNPIKGDDKYDRKVASTWKKLNKFERAGHGELFAGDAYATSVPSLSRQAAEIDQLAVRSLADLHVAEQRLRNLETSAEAQRARLVADAWCAAFVIPKNGAAPKLTQADLDQIAAGGGTVELLEAVRQLHARYRWFHWHLEFPQIFTPAKGDSNPDTGWSGGFDLVIGNPPWERVKLQEQEWFATRRPEIAEAPNASARKKLIAALADEQPKLYEEFLADRRQAEGESHFIRNSGRFPLAGRGDVNTYAVFAETDRSLMAPTGRLGVILPTGIATDATTQYFFKDLVTSKALVSLYDFENSQPIFEGVHRSFKFCLLTLSGRAAPADAARFAFFAHHPRDLARDGATFTLTPEEITLLNPNTGTCPIFRSRRDAEITLAIYRRHPVLIRHGDPDGNPWGVSFMTMFHMSNDSGLFHTREQLERDGWTLDGNTFRRGAETMLPLYEAKMIHHYDHRWATYDGADVRDATEAEHTDPYFVVLPRYWVADGEVESRIADRGRQPWLLGFRNITNTTNERTIIIGTVPLSGVGNSMPLLLGDPRPWLLAATMSSVPVDFVMRQKLGGTNMNFFYVEQLPVPLPNTFNENCPWLRGQTIAHWIELRVLELVYTAWDMKPFAKSLGDKGAPFVWDPVRRAVIRAELDAAFFHICGLDRDDTEYVLSTFPIVNRKDPELAGRVPGAYDAMTKAIESGSPFVSSLDPPPGQGARHPETL